MSTNEYLSLRGKVKRNILGILNEDTTNLSSAYKATIIKVETDPKTEYVNGIRLPHNQHHTIKFGEWR
jgi:hypothetical protein